MCKNNKLTNLILMMACAITFPLLSAVRTSAKTLNSAGSSKSAVVKINGTAKNRLLSALKRAAKSNPKLAKALARGCGCAAAAPDELSGFGSCFSSCMRDVGISPYALIMCGGACAAAATGAGAIICGLCVGVSATVVEWCALGCLAYPEGSGKRPGIIANKLKQNTSPHGPGQTPNLKVQTVGVRG